ncbi:hypothetical protein Patl1_36758 [Pistacia atlantica]|nr:hypothetical protein Patl1_36758 [Pistacia atlantica]
MTEANEDLKQVSYKVVRDENGNVKLECSTIGKQFVVEKISAQRRATKDAGCIASLEVLCIINKPTAASLAYGFEKKNNETILVFDLGVLEVGDGGDTHLGGDDFDKVGIFSSYALMHRDKGMDLLKDKQALQRLTETTEKAKMELSSFTQTNISYVACS